MFRSAGQGIRSSVLFMVRGLEYFLHLWYHAQRGLFHVEGSYALHSPSNGAGIHQRRADFPEKADILCQDHTAEAEITLGTVCVLQNSTEAQDLA